MSADLVKGMITIAVGYAVYAVLGPALVAPGVSEIADTASIVNYTEWTDQQQTMYSSTGTFVMLGWMLVPVALIMALF